VLHKYYIPFPPDRPGVNPTWWMNADSPLIDIREWFRSCHDDLDHIATTEAT